MISVMFFEFYRKTNIVFKILLFGVVLLFGILWVVGSLAKFERAIMWFIGVIVGVILCYIYYPEISNVVNKVINTVKTIF